MASGLRQLHRLRRSQSRFPERLVPVFALEFLARFIASSGHMELRFQAMLGGFALVLLLGLAGTGCRTRAFDRDTVLQEINSRGNIILYVSPSRRIAAVVAQHSALVDQHLPRIQLMSVESFKIRQFKTSQELAIFLYGLWPPRVGDSSTYTNAVCRPARLVCSTNCVPVTNYFPRTNEYWYGLTNYGTNYPMYTYFVGWERDVVEATNFQRCVRDETSSNTCTEFYQVTCRRRFYTDGNCTNLSGSAREIVLSDWVCR
jgi:hypothetical protein